MKFTNDTTGDLDVTNVDPPITVKPGETVELPAPAPAPQSPDAEDEAPAPDGESEPTEEPHKAARSSKGTAK